MQHKFRIEIEDDEVIEIVVVVTQRKFQRVNGKSRTYTNSVLRTQL